MDEVLRRVTQSVSLNIDGVRLLYLGNSAVYLLPCERMVVRIARSRTLHERVRRGVDLARWFALADAPTIRLASVAQPVVVDELLVTFWDYVEPMLPPPHVDDLGGVLRRFHELPIPDLDIPMWSPVPSARLRVRDAGDALSAEEKRFILDWCDRLEPRIRETVSVSPSVLIHGDAHPGNLIRGADVGVVLCDFDSVSIGPRGVDLAAEATARRWFHRSRDAYERLAESYGWDVTIDASWPVLREARELAYLVGGAPLLSSSPAVSRQFRLRLRSLRDNDDRTPWTPYAKLR